jgi:hypothetical protein
MGGALVWAAPPPNRALRDSVSGESVLPCERRVGKGKLLVVANWFPGNFGHFLHDTLPLLLWLDQHARVAPGDRFGLVDDWLHRTVARWLDPALAGRIVWLPLGAVSCVDGLAAVQYATAPPAGSPGHRGTNAAAADGSSPRAAASGSGGASPLLLPPPRLPLLRRDKHTSVWELRNPSLFRNLALALEQLRPDATTHLTPAHLRPQPTLPPPGDGSQSASNGLATVPRQLRASAVGGPGSVEKDHGRGLILFYSRRSSRTQHGRLMTAAHEAACLGILRTFIV